MTEMESTAKLRQ